MLDFLQFLGDEESLVTILDVGAAFIETPSFQRLLDMKRARIIGFEPDEAACGELNDKYGEPHRFLPYFIGDGKPGTYWETNWGPTGSLYKPNTPLLEKFQLLAEVTVPVATHSVATRRLDDISEIDDVDFFKIDVQGSELGIFQNGLRALESALLIQTEVTFVEMYLGQPMFSDIDAFLRRSGFQFHDFVGFGSRAFKPLANPAHNGQNPCLRPFQQKLWADVYYVKDWMRLDVLRPDKLVKYAVLMHEVVRSYDLTHLVLVELDRRTGGRLAERYLQTMQDWGRCGVVRPAGFDANWTPVFSPSAIGTETPSGPETEGVDALLLETNDGTLVSVPTELTCAATYILLEQECWFERELPFLREWMRPGMNVVDVGANVGVYSLPFARRVAPDGSVFAFEPGSANRRHLEIGRSANGIANLCVMSYAVAERERAGWLELAATGDLNALVSSPLDKASAEQVQVTTLDAQVRSNGWPKIDFVKIDAEGQEANIVDGGRGFFQSQSPLVMCEVTDREDSGDVRARFETMGYGTYRLLGDGAFLVPVGFDELLDDYEVNLFYAKADRAAGLAASGRLVLEPGIPALAREEVARAMAHLLALPFARHFEFTEEDIRSCDHARAIIGFAAYRFGHLTPPRRFAVLRDAFESSRACCANRPSAASVVTFSRIAHALGARQDAYDALSRLIGSTVGDVDAPFFPACPRFEFVSPVGNEKEWFAAAVLEQLELVRAHSSLFSVDDGFGNLKRLCDGPFASSEMLRRIVLKGVLSGWSPAVLAEYVDETCRHLHRNADFWAQENLSRMVAEVWAARNRAKQ